MSKAGECAAKREYLAVAGGLFRGPRLRIVAELRLDPLHPVVAFHAVEVSPAIACDLARWILDVCGEPS